MPDSAANLLRDLGDELWRMAAAARTGGYDFDRGRLTGLYEAVSLLHQQAVTFGLDAAAVGLAGRDPESLLASG